MNNALGILGTLIVAGVVSHLVVNKLHKDCTEKTLTEMHTTDPTLFAENLAIAKSDGNAMSLFF